MSEEQEYRKFLLQTWNNVDETQKNVIIDYFKKLAVINTDSMTDEDERLINEIIIHFSSYQRKDYLCSTFVEHFMLYVGTFCSILGKVCNINCKPQLFYPTVFINFMNSKVQAGGGSPKLFILGRNRIVKKKGRSSYITYKCNQITITEARKIERTLKKTKC